MNRAIDLNKTVSSDFLSISNSETMQIEIFIGEDYFETFNLKSFSKKKITFGRNSNNDIIINSSIVSGNHGYFLIEGSQCVVYDNNSTNGLIIEGKKQLKYLLNEEKIIRIDNINNTLKSGVTIIFSNSSSNNEWIEVTLKNNLTIGRSNKNDIQLKHVSISNEHARIIQENDVWYLEDLDSTNGVIVNGIGINKKSELKNKDIFKICNTTFLFGNEKLLYKQSYSGVKIQASNIVKTVKTKKGMIRIADDISLTINPGEFVAIVGGSGAGKSTFMNCISGFNKATSGNVLIDESDLYSNYSVLKGLIGYVPQQDIVYDNLSLKSMLYYTAKMRMPSDTSNLEIEARINEVIEIVELTERKNTFIRQLSGGQKKRASIAVELLADPSLLFLDEPTSGLDPGTERNLMYTLKRMSSFGKTIVLVTHTTLNLHLCDKILFLGKGGKLCYFGTPENATKFFNVESLVDVYNLLNNDTEYWFEKYKKESNIKSIKIAENIKVKEKPVNLFSQFLLLSKRYANLILNDRNQLLLLTVQAPVLGIFLFIVVNDDIFNYYDHTKAILFTMACSVIWMGLLNSIQEICKERIIFKREHASNLKVIPYILSKVTIQAFICIVQSILYFGTIAILFGIPEKGIMFDNSIFEMILTTFLISFAASTTGLLVSAISPSTEIAMITAPILLVPQMLFSGMLFKLDGIVDSTSYFIMSRWGMEAYGSIANLNSLPLEIQKDFAIITRESEKFFEVTTKHLSESWYILLALSFAMILATIIYQKRVADNK